MIGILLNKNKNLLATEKICSIDFLIEAKNCFKN